MLVNRRKNKSHVSTLPNEESIQSFRSWIRRIEQSTNSLSSRLSAVEKRISHEKLANPNQLLGEMKKGGFERFFTGLQDGKRDEKFLELSRLLDSEFSSLQEEMISQQNEINSLKEKIDRIDSFLTGFQQEIKQLHFTDSNILKNVNAKIEKFEQRKPPMMKLGRVEIPIEITGVIGGVLAFVIAILFALGEKEIVISPVFLSFIGLILIGSALFKSFRLESSFDKRFKKTGKIEEHSRS